MLAVFPRQKDNIPCSLGTPDVKQSSTWNVIKKAFKLDWS
jgi:hypothetical protein